MLELMGNAVLRSEPLGAVVLVSVDQGIIEAGVGLAQI